MPRLIRAGRIGVKAIQSNALLAAQKKNGSATINEKSLKHFSDSSNPPGSRSDRRSPSPSKASTSSGGKGKGKVSAKNSDDEEEEEDSGDEAEKLDDDQMNELDNIYRKCVLKISVSGKNLTLSGLSKVIQSWKKRSHLTAFCIPYDPIKNKL